MIEVAIWLRIVCWKLEEYLIRQWKRPRIVNDDPKEYPPLFRAMQPGQILDPASIPENFSLYDIIKDSLYADSLIIYTKEEKKLYR